MREGHHRSREDLHLLELAVDGRRAEAPEDAKEHGHDETARHDGDDRRGDQREHDLADAVEVQAIRADRDEHRTDDTADERMRRARRHGKPPGNEVPDDSADERRNDHVFVDMLSRLDDVRADGLRDARAVHGTEKVEERRHDDGVARMESSRGDGRCNGIGCIVEAIDEVKQQCEPDDCKDQELEFRHTSLPLLGAYLQSSRSGRACSRGSRGCPST